MKKTLWVFLLVFGFNIISHAQTLRLHWEAGPGLAFPYEEHPIGLHAFLFKSNLNIPVASSGDLLFGTGFLMYKISYKESSYSDPHDVISAAYSFILLDRPEFMSNIFAGYQVSDLLIGSLGAKSPVSHSVILGIEGGPDFIKLRITLHKILTPIPIFNNNEVFKVYPTVLTFTVVF